MRELILYIHGKGGSAAECEHYRPLFPESDVIGLDYRGLTPREAGPEIRAAVRELRAAHGSIILIANSIGAYLAMGAGIDAEIRRAFFISPIVDMERLICDMLAWEGLSEAELKARGRVAASFGEELSWDELCYVRAHPLRWTAPTEILYGQNDGLTRYETVAAFARKIGAGLTVMEGGEHWFHTPQQMAFLDAWIRNAAERETCERRD